MLHLAFELTAAVDAEGDNVGGDVENASTGAGADSVEGSGSGNDVDTAGGEDYVDGAGIAFCMLTMALVVKAALDPVIGPAIPTLTCAWLVPASARPAAMIRKLKSGGYRLYSRKVNPKTDRRRNLGTFKTRAAAEKHERAVQYFKRH